MLSIVARCPILPDDDGNSGLSFRKSTGGEGGGRTHTHSEVRQILSLVRLPVPPLRHESGFSSVANPCGNLHVGLSAKYTAFAVGGRQECRTESWNWQYAT